MNYPLPMTDNARTTWQFAMGRLGCAIFNHSVRTYLHACREASRLELAAGRDYDDEVLFCACLLHDIGTAAEFDGPQRFEVEGADAAVTLLSSLGFGAADTQQVWQAISLHTSPGIAERMGPLTLLLRRGVVADFSEHGGAFEIEQLHQAYPRSQVEIALADAVVAQALDNAAKAPASSWPGGLLRAHLADPDQLTNSAF
jgi:HD superfamily phosphohydrolase YqeK